MCLSARRIRHLALYQETELADEVDLLMVSKAEDSRLIFLQHRRLSTMFLLQQVWMPGDAAVVAVAEEATQEATEGEDEVSKEVEVVPVLQQWSSKHNQH